MPLSHPYATRVRKAPWYAPWLSDIWEVVCSEGEFRSKWILLTDRRRTELGLRTKYTRITRWVNRDKEPLVPTQAETEADDLVKKAMETREEIKDRRRRERQEKGMW